MYESYACAIKFFSRWQRQLEEYINNKADDQHLSISAALHGFFIPIKVVTDH